MYTDPPCFLNLPREIRDIIYRQYVSVGGYTYNFKTGKLRTINNDPIDLALMFTCQQVACEMKGVALRYNTIHFRTTFEDDTRHYSYVYQELMRHASILIRDTLEAVEECFTQEIRDKVIKRYPKFERLFDNVNRQWEPSRLGSVPSMVSDGVRYALQLASTRPLFAEKIARYETARAKRSPPPDIGDVLAMDYKPWTIPTKDELCDLAISCGCYSTGPPSQNTSTPYEKGKHCFSAAAASINFLESIPSTTRAQIRNIVLHEDHPSICEPSSHARGLIKFCKANPRLRIERRADIWKNVFLHEAIKGGRLEFELDLDDQFIHEKIKGELSMTMTRSIALWTMEALALVPAGMPEGSFSLVFEGGSMPIQRTEEIFQKVIQQDAAMQLALEMCIRHKYIPACNPFVDMLYECHSFDSFPQALRAIVDGENSVVQFDFNPGDYSKFDVHQMAYERRRWTRKQWDGYDAEWFRYDGPCWLDHEGVSLDTCPPLPSWRELINEACKMLPRG